MDTRQSAQLISSVKDLQRQIEKFSEQVREVEVTQQANIRMKEKLESEISAILEKSKENREALDICTNAIDILRAVSDEAVGKAYKFLEENLNAALDKMFTSTVRKVHLREYTRSGQYPQLEIELTVAGGKKRSLKADSGHGLAQIVSLMSILCLIVITNSRRILVMDEVLSGISVHNRQIMEEVLWTFTEIGFQFIVNEHGYVPKGSKVYHLEMVGDVSGVKESYIEKSGVYLNGKSEYNDEIEDDD